jgi:hypothetical protein
MLEDKLRAEERIRLEALAQAIIASGAVAGRAQASGDTLRRAKAFEDYIITGNVPR